MKDATVIVGQSLLKQIWYFSGDDGLFFLQTLLK